MTPLRSSSLQFGTTSSQFLPTSAPPRQGYLTRGESFSSVVTSSVPFRDRLYQLVAEQEQLRASLAAPTLAPAPPSVVQIAPTVMQPALVPSPLVSPLASPPIGSPVGVSIATNANDCQQIYPGYPYPVSTGTPQLVGSATTTVFVAPTDFVAPGSAVPLGVTQPLGPQASAILGAQIPLGVTAPAFSQPRMSSTDVGEPPSLVLMTEAVPAFPTEATKYQANNADMIDVALACTLWKINPSELAAMSLRRIDEGRYEVDGRRVTLAWRDETQNELMLFEDDVVDGEWMPVLDYLQIAGNVALTTNIQSAMAPPGHERASAPRGNKEGWQAQGEAATTPPTDEYGADEQLDESDRKGHMERACEEAGVRIVTLDEVQPSIARPPEMFTGYHYTL